MRRELMSAMVVLGVAVGNAVAQQDLFKQDYFAAQSDPVLRATLDTVERHHFGQPVIDAFRNGEWVTVIGDLKFTLNRFPNHPRALMMMVAVGKLSSQPKLALKHFEEALELYPQYALTHAQYGQYLMQLGDYSAGILKLKDALALDPSLAVAHAWLAEASFKSGDVAAGAAAAARARELGYSRAIPGETP